MRRYLTPALLGAFVAAVDFLLLLFLAYDSVIVETIFGIVVFFAYTRSASYRAMHAKDARAMFFAFIAFLVGVSMGYVFYLLVLAGAFMIAPGPVLSM